MAGCRSDPTAPVSVWHAQCAGAVHPDAKPTAWGPSLTAGGASALTAQDLGSSHLPLGLGRLPCPGPAVPAETCWVSGVPRNCTQQLSPSPPGPSYLSGQSQSWKVSSGWYLGSEHARHLGSFQDQRAKSFFPGYLSTYIIF